MTATSALAACLSSISLSIQYDRGKREERCRYYCLLSSCSFAVRSGVTCPHDLGFGQMSVRVDCQLFVCRRHAQLQILSDHGKLAAPETLRYLARRRVALAFCNCLANALKLR